MKAKSVFAEAKKKVGLNQVQIADLAGMPKQSVTQMINVRESVTADVFFKVMDAMGIDVRFRVRKTGELIMADDNRAGICGKSDGVFYDKEESEKIASSFYADGENQYGPDGKAQELYVDRCGRYFVVEYSDDKDVNPRVRSVPELMATAFIRQYGTKGAE